MTKTTKWILIILAGYIAMGLFIAALVSALISPLSGAGIFVYVLLWPQIVASSLVGFLLSLFGIQIVMTPPAP